MVDIAILAGKIITSIKVHCDSNDDFIDFTCDDGKKYRLGHIQDFCEHVYIKDLCGEIKNLLNTEIIYSNSSSSEIQSDNDEFVESMTWTFYRIGTINGGLAITWYGESSGCSSEKVDFWEIKDG